MTAQEQIDAYIKRNSTPLYLQQTVGRGTTKVRKGQASRKDQNKESNVPDLSSLYKTNQRGKTQ